MHADRIAKSRIPRTVWCCTCDAEPTEAGPASHLYDHPGHYVIEVYGDLHVWRHQAGMSTQEIIEAALAEVIEDYADAPRYAQAVVDALNGGDVGTDDATNEGSGKG